VAAIARAPQPDTSEPETREPTPSPPKPQSFREQPPRFDRVARLYQAMEYLTFGRFLERCRFHHLPALTRCQRALMIGDGDGRFLARLLAVAPNLRADAIDASPAMLSLLQARVAKTKTLSRLTTTCADARNFEPIGASYDLVATHFFLDCLTEDEAASMIVRLNPRLAPGARWVVSEFQISSRGRLRVFLARNLITALYAAFRLLTGLRVRKIPPWRSLLERHGFRCEASRSWLGGLLVSELWICAASNHPSGTSAPTPV
jgi:ubiquinone/menaquinone biosynthesis C-methylase UbiE